MNHTADLLFTHLLSDDELYFSYLMWLAALERENHDRKAIPNPNRDGSQSQRLDGLPHVR